MHRVLGPQPRKAGMRHAVGIAVMVGNVQKAVIAVVFIQMIGHYTPPASARPAVRKAAIHSANTAPSVGWARLASAVA